MRIVPVLDLKDGIVVHARRGERGAYAPLESPLLEGSEPVAVARALIALTRSPILYVADLDAISGGEADVETLTALAELAEVWVDAGAVTAAGARRLARTGATRNIVGTESIDADPVETAERLATGPPPVLSVDLREGRLISPRSDLDGRGPAAVAPLASVLGVRELIVIDLARVGSASGPPLREVSALAAALTGVEIHAGGGVRDDADLAALAGAGAAGALVATALHAGRITL